MFADKKIIQKAITTPLGNELSSSYIDICTKNSLDHQDAINFDIMWNNIKSVVTARLCGDTVSLSMRSVFAGATNYTKLASIKETDLNKPVTLLSLATQKFTDFINIKSQYSFLEGEDESGITGAKKANEVYGINISQKLLNTGKTDMGNLLAARQFCINVSLPCHAQKPLLDAIKLLGFTVFVDDYNHSISARIFPDNLWIDIDGLISANGTTQDLKFIKDGYQINGDKSNLVLSDLTKVDIQRQIDEEGTLLLTPLLLQVQKLLKHLSKPHTRFADQTLLTDLLS